jgi:hypothetical protein
MTVVARAELLRQCDETLPICQRCTKSRRICLSEDTSRKACFSINIENLYASGKTKRPRGPRSSLTVLRPNLDLQTRALAYYVKYHLRTLPEIPNVSGGISESVSAWTQSGRKCDMVDLALSSIALAVYSRTQRHPPAAAEASSKYYKLLCLAQINIPEVDKSNIDACLLAAFLMGRYESINHHPGKFGSENPLKSIKSWSHYDGSLAILRIWSETSTHNAASPIIKYTRRQLIKSTLAQTHALPDWIQDGYRFGEEGLELEYDRIVVRLVKLRHTLSKMKTQQVAQFENLNTQARELDESLQIWITKIPDIGSCNQHIIPESDSVPWPKKSFYSPVVCSYSNPGLGAVWLEYLTTRMLVINSRLRILEQKCVPLPIELTYKNEQLECIITFQSTVDNLVSSIPFCLERFVTNAPISPASEPSFSLNKDQAIMPYLANWVVWPLTIASTLERVNPEQRRWLKSELAGLGRTIGNGVLECAETHDLVIQ